MEMKLTNYTVFRVETISYNDEYHVFLARNVPQLSEMFGDQFNYKRINLINLVKSRYLYFCKRNDEITGFFLAHLGCSPFDPKLKIFQQDTLYAVPGSGRTGYHLFKKFIDIGKLKADHIITMLTSKTNIKPESLEKLGFKELETLYRLEV